MLYNKSFLFFFCCHTDGNLNINTTDFCYIRPDFISFVEKHEISNSGYPIFPKRGLHSHCDNKCVKVEQAELIVTSNRQFPCFSLSLDFSSVVRHKTSVVCFDNGFCFHNNFRIITEYLFSLEWNQPQLSWLFVQRLRPWNF